MRKLKGVIIQDTEDEKAVARLKEADVKAGEVTAEDLKKYLNSLKRSQWLEMVQWNGINDNTALVNQKYDFAIVHDKLENGTKGVEKVKAIVESGIEIPIIFVGDRMAKNLGTDFLPSHYKRKGIYRELGIVDSVSRKDLTPEEYKEAIKASIAAHIRTPLRIGLLSMGRLNQKVLEILFKQHRDYIHEVVGYSMTGLHTYESITRKLNINDHNFTMAPSLEALIARNNDIIIASSSAKSKSRVEPGRNWLWETEKDAQFDELSRIAAIEGEMRKSGDEPRSFYLVATNPIGPIMYLANKLGIPGDRLSGLSVAGRQRFVKWIRDKFYEKHKIGISESQVRCDVIGQHGMEFPQVDSVEIQDKEGVFRPAKYYGMELNAEEAKKYLREEGGKLMADIARESAEEQYEALYNGVPEATVDLIGRLALRQERPESLLYIVTGNGAFNREVEFSFNPAGIKFAMAKDQRYQKLIGTPDHAQYLETDMIDASYQKESAEGILKSHNKAPAGESAPVGK